MLCLSEGWSSDVRHGASAAELAPRDTYPHQRSDDCAAQHCRGESVRQFHTVLVRIYVSTYRRCMFPRVGDVGTGKARMSGLEQKKF